MITRVSVRGLLASAIFTLTLFGSAGVAHAVPESENNKTLAGLFVNVSTAFIGINSPGVSATCTFGVSFNPTTSIGRIWYATLLEAVSTNAVVDIGYDRNGNSCTLTQVTIR